MVHQSQGLPLRLEAGNYLPGVHAGLDELDRDQALDRFGLLGHPDRAHAALADLFEQLVRADDHAGELGNRRDVDSRSLGGRRRLQEAAGLVVLGEQGRKALPQVGVPPAGALEERGPDFRRLFQRGFKYFALRHGITLQSS